MGSHAHIHTPKNQQNRSQHNLNQNRSHNLFTKQNPDPKMMRTKFNQMYREKPLVSQETIDEWVEEHGEETLMEDHVLLFTSKIKTLKLTESLVEGYARVTHADETDVEKRAYDKFDGDMVKVAQKLIRDIIHEMTDHFFDGYLYPEENKPLRFD
jgi:hypothetical protein